MDDLLEMGRARLRAYDLGFALDSTPTTGDQLGRRFTALSPAEHYGQSGPTDAAGTGHLS
jgi:hypothetical protein